MFSVVLPSLLPVSAEDSSVDSEDSSGVDSSDVSAAGVSGVDAGASVPASLLPQAVIEARSAAAESTDKSFFIFHDLHKYKFGVFGIPSYTL
jgi:hypothetical protein